MTRSATSCSAALSQIKCTFKTVLIYETAEQKLLVSNCTLAVKCEKINERIKSSSGYIFSHLLPFYE
jgi:hypothetical protein